MSEEVNEIPVTEPTSEPISDEAPSNNWYDGMDDAMVGMIQNKGWDQPGDVIEAYKNLESYHGVPADQLMKIPKDGSAESWGEVWERIGRPQASDQYEMAIPEGMAVNEELFNQARQTAFENGVTATAFTKMMDLYNQSVLDGNNAFEQSEAESLEQQKADLKREWGPNMDESIFMADKAMRELGLSDEAQQIIQTGLGYDEMYKMFKKVGELTAEKNPEGGESRSDFGKTPQELKYEKEMLLADVGASRDRSAAYGRNEGPDYIRYQQIMKQLDDAGQFGNVSQV